MSAAACAVKKNASLSLLQMPGMHPRASHALQALAFAKEAVEGFEESTGSSREAALDATRQAADFAQLAHKLMRAVYKGK